jgi:hypothetical protein
LDSARYVCRSSEQSRKSSISKSSSDQKLRKSSKTSYSTNADLVPPSSSISIPLGSTLHGRRVQDRSEDESASRHLYQCRSYTTEQNDTTSIVSKGTSTLVHEVDELIDGASSVMRGIDAAVGYSADDQGKNAS